VKGQFVAGNGCPYEVLKSKPEFEGGERDRELNTNKGGERR